MQSLIPPLDKKTFCRPSPALGNAGLQPEESAEEEFGSRAGVEVIFFCLQKQSLGHRVLTQLFQQLRLWCHLGQIRLKSHVLVLPGLTPGLGKVCAGVARPKTSFPITQGTCPNPVASRMAEPGAGGEKKGETPSTSRALPSLVPP